MIKNNKEFLLVWFMCVTYGMCIAIPIIAVMVVAKLLFF